MHAICEDFSEISGVTGKRMAQKAPRLAAPLPKFDGQRKYSGQMTNNSCRALRTITFVVFQST